MESMLEKIKENKISYYNELAMQAKTDQDAFSELYDAFFPRVYNFLFGKMKDSDAADEVVSITFEKMLLSLDKYDKEKAAFSTWLFRIAGNAMTDYFRLHQRRHEATWEDFFDPADERATPEQSYLKAEGSEEILKALGTLSERERSIVTMKFWGGMSNKEIGSEIGITSSNVGVILHRCMSKLKGILGDLAID